MLRPMLRQSLRTLPFLALAAAQLLTAAPAPAAAQATAAETYVSPTYGYSLTYDASWEVLVDTSDQANDFLRLYNETSFMMLEGTKAFGGDAEDCVTGMVASFSDLAPHSDFVLAMSEGEPMTGGDATNFYAVYNYTYTTQDGSEEDWMFDAQCFTLIPGEATVAFVQDVPVEAYNGELPTRNQLLAGLNLAAATTPTASDVSGSETVTGTDAGDADPAQSDLATLVDSVTSDVDAFWAASFEANGVSYASPTVQLFDMPITTGCGETTPGENGSFYCPVDQTIYLDSVELTIEVQSYGIAPVLQTIAHEWGHHVQQQTGALDTSTSVALSVNGSTSLETELQADCFTGVWFGAADQGGQLGPGLLEDVIVFVAGTMGDPAEASSLAPQTQYDLQHGSGALRTWWLLQGYQFGMEPCLA